MVGGIGKAASTAWRKFSGKEARENIEQAKAILAEHEARDHFGAQEARDRLIGLLGEKEGNRLFSSYVNRRIEAIIKTALSDNVLNPDEDARIGRMLNRYGDPKLDRESQAIMQRARDLHHSMTAPFAEVKSPLLLRKGEFCVFGAEAEAMEERSRTVRVNYGGPTARIKIVKGVYYSMGSLAVNRQTESYVHSFGNGVLAATNKRILWMSPAKTVNIPLPKIVMFEPFSDGVKIHKETGKPIVFSWANDGGVGSVWVGRIIEELRHS